MSSLPATRRFPFSPKKSEKSPKKSPKKSFREAADILIATQKANDEYRKKRERTTGEPYSAVVEGLTGAQGTLAVISALLAGFAFSGLTAVTPEDAERVHPTIAMLYYTTTTVSVAVQLFVCVVCTLLEQEGKVARGLAMARASDAASSYEYEEQLKGWYGRQEFAVFRTQIIWAFVFGVPCFAISLAFLCLLKIYRIEVALVCFSCFAFVGFLMLRYILWLNEMFRVGVLGLREKFSSPRVSWTKKKEGPEDDEKAKEIKND